MRNGISRRAVEVLAPEEKPVDEAQPEVEAPMKRIAFALHEMCQPLMSLQYRLEIAKMIGTAEAYEEAVRESLIEYERLRLSVDVLRNEVVRGLEAERPT
jgi:hypothetical protein